MSLFIERRVGESFTVRLAGEFMADGQPAELKIRVVRVLDDATKFAIDGPRLFDVWRQELKR